jgi:hypothetical protein
MRSFALVAFACVAALSACKNVVVSEAEAKDLGKKALIKYCAERKLSPQGFELAAVTPGDEAQWLLIYKSSGIKPAQEVAVTIGKKGDAEVHIGYDGLHD